MSLDPDPTTTAADLRWLREQEREIRERARRVDWDGTLTAEQTGYHNSLLALADRYARIAGVVERAEQDRIDLATALLSLGAAWPDPRVSIAEVDVRDVVRRQQHEFNHPPVRPLSLAEADSVIAASRAASAP